MPYISFDPDMPKTKFLFYIGIIVPSMAMEGKDNKKLISITFGIWLARKRVSARTNLSCINPKGQKHLLSSPFLSASFIDRLDLPVEKLYIKMLSHDS